MYRRELVCWLELVGKMGILGASSPKILHCLERAQVDLGEPKDTLAILFGVWGQSLAVLPPPVTASRAG